MGEPLTTLETVARETPARAATSSRVVPLRRPRVARANWVSSADCESALTLREHHNRPCQESALTFGSHAVAVSELLDPCRRRRRARTRAVRPRTRPNSHRETVRPVLRQSEDPGRRNVAAGGSLPPTSLPLCLL